MTEPEEVEKCPYCKGYDVEEIDNDYLKCRDCKAEYVG